MKKYFLLYCFSAALLGAPGLSFAATITTDASCYESPANTINYSGANGSNGMVLYKLSTPSLPLCQNGTPPAASGVLNSQTFVSSCTPGTFNTSQTGDYAIIFLEYATCVGSSYATCVSANSGGAPGNEADFEIATNCGGGSNVPLGGATSTLDQAQKNLSTAFFLYFISFFGMIWLLRRRS